MSRMQRHAEGAALVDRSPPRPRPETAWGRPSPLGGRPDTPPPPYQNPPQIGFFLGGRSISFIPPSSRPDPGGWLEIPKSRPATSSRLIPENERSAVLSAG